MRSLGGVSIRTLRRSARRHLLTGIGASLGVAVLFAVLVTSAASRDALAAELAGATGDADVVVSPTGAFDSLLPDGTADLVRGLAGVDRVVATTGFRSAVREPGLATPVAGDPDTVRDRIVFVTGVDDDFATVNRLELTEGRDPTPGAAEAMAPQRLADDLDLALGDRIEVATPAGPAPVEIVALLADTGAADANQGAVLYTTRATVDALTGRSGDGSLQVVLADGVEVSAWIDEHRAALRGVSVQDATDLAAGFRSFIDAVNGALTVVAAIAVFIGGFLVYLTFSVAVAERTRVLGTLRALGTPRRRVLRMVVVEAVALGALCAVVGVVLGYGLASVAVGALGSLLGLDLGAVGLPLGAAVLSVVVGVVVAAAAAWIPARRAGRVDPVSAMRGGALAIERTPRRWIGPSLLAVGIGVDLLAGPSIALHGLGMLVVLAGAVLSVHLAVGPVAGAIGSLTARLAPGTGGIAVRHLRLERTRSSFTLALVMVALGTVIAVGATNLAMSVTLDTILDRQASAIQVGAPGAVADDVAGDLAAVPGTGTISPVRFGAVELAAPAEGAATEPADFSPASLQVIDPATFFAVSSLPYTEGDDDTTLAALTAGGALVLPAGDANRLGVGAGDDVLVTTRGGVETFEVVGVYAVVGGGFGAVAGVADLDRLGAGRVNGFLVGTDGSDPEVVAQAIRDTVAADRILIVDSPADTRAYAEAQLAGFFGMAYAILVVAAVISLLGLANTLVVTILDRTREIGILRSTGARRRQIRAMVTVEATTMAAVAYVLAVPLGGMLAFGIINVQREQIAAGISYQYPWGLVVPLGLVTVVVAGLAAVAPARRAARMEIVDTLRYE